MLKRKRSSDFLLHEEEPDLHILIQDSPEPLAAHSSVLRMLSKCVRDLPLNKDGGPTVWDLRQLVLAGSSTAVTAALVELYLTIAYARVDASRRVKPPRSLEEAKQLLLFADAVASGNVVFEQLDTILSSVDDLGFAVRVGDDRHVDLKLKGHLYFLSGTEGLRDYPVPYLGRFTMLVPADDPQLTAHPQHIRDAVSSALEEWLHLAGRLRMMRLMRLLLAFAKTQLVVVGVGLMGKEDLRTIYSPRVLQCMPPELLVEGFLRDALSDTPSEVLLEAKAGVSARLATPSSASFLRLNAGSAADVSLTLEGNQWSIRDGQGAWARLRAYIGGLDATDRTALVRELLARTEGGE